MEDTVLEDIASYIRYLILGMTHDIGSGHPTSSFSAVDLMTMLFFKYLRCDMTNFDDLANDRVIFSKGHASALLYALYTAAGCIPESDMLGYRKFQTNYEGHPTFRFPYSQAATGSLGQGLSIGAGMAYALRRLFAVGGKAGKSLDIVAKAIYDATIIPFSVPRVFVLIGDGEMAEGSVWEAIHWAGFKKLSNVIAIIDVNRFGQTDITMEDGNTLLYTKRFEAFGWGAIAIDGHNFGEIDAAYEKALTYHAGPVAIIARTKKGAGLPFWEDKNGWHNRMLPPEELKLALEKYKPKHPVKGVVQKPDIDAKSIFLQAAKIEQDEPDKQNQVIDYDKSVNISTKLAFGYAMVRLGKDIPELTVFDADVAGSLHTDLFKNVYEDRFLEMYVAEQNMIGVALGISKLGLKPIINTFAAFLLRSHDQIRMLPLSNATVIINGSYAGVSVGRDGPSQMGLEDIAMFRSVYGSTVLYPSDPYQTEFLATEMTKLIGVAYIRTTREATPVLYTNEDVFPIGGSKVFSMEKKKGQKDMITVVAAGITLHEALKAQQKLYKKDICIRVIDCYSIKPIDKKTLDKAAKETKAMIVVEDHYQEGGLGEAIRSAIGLLPIPFHHLAVRKLPMSGSADELLVYEEIGCDAIVRAVCTLEKVGL